MIDRNTAPWGAFILRLALGILFLLHGVWLKAFVFGMDGAGGYFASLGLPGWFAWVVMVYETLGGLALIFAFHARLVALLLGVHLLVAAWIGHWANGWLFSAPGGGYEYPVFWAVACFVLTLLGPGRFAPKRV